jgi:hypothetical protein
MGYFRKERLISYEDSEIVHFKGLDSKSFKFLESLFKIDAKTVCNELRVEIWQLSFLL